MRYIKKSETEPRDLREYKKNCRKASPPLKITYKDKSIKWHIRDMLDQCNINERTVYPGLDGIAMWLKRHYYVR